MEKIATQVFKLDEMCENPKICVIGKRGCGKSYLHGDILNQFNHIPATIISPTEENNPFYCQFKNVNNIHYKYDSTIVREVLENQKRKIYESSDNGSNDGLNDGTSGTNEYSDTLNQLLDKIGNVVESSMVTNSLTNRDIKTMKNLVDQLVNEKQNLFVKNQLRETYETLGQLLNQDVVKLNQLDELKDSINNINIDSLSSDEEKQNARTSAIKHMLFLDDCLWSGIKWSKDEQLLNLFFNSKSHHLTYVLTMQYPLGLSPEIRSEFDYIFLFADDNIPNLKRIYEHYAGFFPDFNSFLQVFHQLTADYGCMVIKTRGIRTSILDKIAFYKAPPLHIN